LNDASDAFLLVLAVARAVLTVEFAAQPVVVPCMHTVLHIDLLLVLSWLLVVSCNCRYKTTQDVEDLVDSLLRIARAAISNSVKQQQQAGTATATADNDVDVDAVDEDFEDDDGVSHYYTKVTRLITYYCCYNMTVCITV
jgi:hypothetical protein